MDFKLSPSTKVFVAGHKGLVGSACVRALQAREVPVLTADRKDLDLSDAKAVLAFFKKEQPAAVILAAAKVGGIGANSTYPVEFMLENLAIQNSVIPAAATTGVQKLAFLGSSCIYPKKATYPLTEDQLLTGPLEPTNEAYALAKIAGIKLCEYYRKEYGKDFISLQPTNMYGPNDRYDFENGHVIPAMLLKVLRAQAEGKSKVTLWGTGVAKREFLHADDLAEGILVCLEKYSADTLINIGSESEVSIRELAEMVIEACQYQGGIAWDASKPDGTLRKVMDSSKIHALGWKPKIDLRSGLKSTLKEAKAALQKIRP